MLKTIRNWVKTNLEIIRVMNSCSRTNFEELLNRILELPDHMKYFTSKRYIWNIIRGRDYYKMLAHYVCVCIETNNHARAEQIIRIVSETESDQAVIKSFIWAVMKQVPLLTTVTIQFASPEKIKSILSSDKVILTDDALIPFVDYVMELRKQIKDLEDQIEAIQSFIN